MIRIMVVDSNINQLEALKQYFSSSEVINVVSTFKDASEFLNYKNYNVDCIVVNVFMNGLEGIKLLTSIKEMNLKSKVIITGDYFSNSMMEHIKLFEPDYVIKGNYLLKDLEDIICFVSDIKPVNNNDLDLKITNLLHTLGVPSHVKGFNYIRDSIKFMYGNSSLIGAITKELYPMVAEANSTTKSKVERAIRHAIEVAWNRGDYDKMEELFGNSVDFDRAKPTNSEFIVTLADRLQLENSF